MYPPILSVAFSLDRKIGAAEGTDSCAVPSDRLVKYRRKLADWMGGHPSTLGIDEDNRGRD